MNVSRNKFLCWGLLCEILQTTLYHLLLATAEATTHAEAKQNYTHTQSHQRREDALRGTAGHGEAAVRAGVAGRQRLAEVVGRLLAHDAHLRGQVGVVLLLLHNNRPIRNRKNSSGRVVQTASAPER
jgi:hypothetical protein